MVMVEGEFGVMSYSGEKFAHARQACFSALLKEGAVHHFYAGFLGLMC